MPSRVIRGDLLTSDSLASVSRDAAAFFVHLLLAVDDFGRSDGRAGVIRSKCYPLRDDVTVAEVESWIRELETCDEDGKGPVERYRVRGRLYLRLVNWELHRSGGKRGAKSRWPGPEEADPEPECVDQPESEGDRGDPRTPEDSRGSPREPEGTRGDPGGPYRGSEVAGKRGSEVAELLPQDPSDPEGDAPSRVAPPGSDDLEQRCARWVNVLSKEPGTRDSKLAFLRHELVRIEHEAFSEVPKAARDKAAVNAKTRSKIVGWYRQRLKPKAAGGARASPPRGSRASIEGRDGWSDLEGMT